MPPLTLGARLLQTPGGLEDVGRAVSANREVPLAAVLLAAGALLVVLAVASLRHRGAGGSLHSAAPAGPSALRIGWRVTRARGVGLSGCLLLLRIARNGGLDNPLPLLAASGTLYHHGRQYAAGLPVPRRRRVLRALSRLQRELFAEGRPEAPAPVQPAPSAAPAIDRRARARADIP